MFIDEADIHVKGGRGGDGCGSFRREKYRPHGGPDGGNGGPGGNVVIRSLPGKGTLRELHGRRLYAAGDGKRGGASDRTGARGKDVVISVPCGTVVMGTDAAVLADLLEPEMEYIAATGGRGGRGNAALVGEAGPLPGFAEKGEAGDERDLHLELKLAADVAIVGYPNAGKSTLVSRISRAKPRIADYPFTTTEPCLGVVSGDETDFIVTDVPGLIDGAHLGKGMGTRFLRHIERVAVIVYLIDASPLTGRCPAEDLESLEEELRLFDQKLADRPKIVAANKMDLSPNRDEMERLKSESEDRGMKFQAISAATGEGVRELLNNLQREVCEARSEGVRSGFEVEYTDTGSEDIVVVKRKGEGFVVEGRRVEKLVQMTDWNNREAREYLSNKLRMIGIEDMLEAEGATTGDEVEIAGRVFEFIPGREYGT